VRLCVRGVGRCGLGAARRERSFERAVRRRIEWTCAMATLFPFPALRRSSSACEGVDWLACGIEKGGGEEERGVQRILFLTPALLSAAR
jgi:hypothetical protein